jgi:hypothetical protein
VASAVVAEAGIYYIPMNLKNHLIQYLKCWSKRIKFAILQVIIAKYWQLIIYHKICKINNKNAILWGKQVQEKIYTRMTNSRQINQFMLWIWNVKSSIKE